MGSEGLGHGSEARSREAPAAGRALGQGSSGSGRARGARRREPGRAKAKVSGLPPTPLHHHARQELQSRPPPPAPEGGFSVHKPGLDFGSGGVLSPSRRSPSTPAPPDSPSPGYRWPAAPSSSAATATSSGAAAVPRRPPVPMAAGARGLLGSERAALARGGHALRRPSERRWGPRVLLFHAGDPRAAAPLPGRALETAPGRRRAASPATNRERRPSRWRPRPPAAAARALSHDVGAGNSALRPRLSLGSRPRALWVAMCGLRDRGTRGPTDKLTGGRAPGLAGGGRAAGARAARARKQRGPSAGPGAGRGKRRRGSGLGRDSAPGRGPGEGGKAGRRGRCRPAPPRPPPRLLCRAPRWRPWARRDRGGAPDPRALQPRVSSSFRPPEAPHRPYPAAQVLSLPLCYFVHSGFWRIPDDFFLNTALKCLFW